MNQPESGIKNWENEVTTLQTRESGIVQYQFDGKSAP